MTTTTLTAKPYDISQAPEGLKFLAESGRSVYTHEDYPGVVFKAYSRDNINEADCYKKLGNEIRGCVRLAACWLLENNWLMMERAETVDYFARHTPEWLGFHDTIIEAWRDVVDDLHIGNIGRIGDDLVVIDYAAWRSTPRQR